jgi:hypothetical protein
MFAPDTPMTLTDVTFTTEVEDEETRRIVVCTFALAPFTPAHAEALNIRSLLFDASTGTLKPAIDAVTALISHEDQRLTFAMTPDQQDRRIVLPNVRIEEKLKAKIKHDREPAVCEATLKISFSYPTADQLLYIANGVNDTHYLTFEPEQGDLLTSMDDDEPIRRGRSHGAAATH